MLSALPAGEVTRAKSHGRVKPLIFHGYGGVRRLIGNQTLRAADPFGFDPLPPLDRARSRPRTKRGGRPGLAIWTGRYTDMRCLRQGFPLDLRMLVRGAGFYFRKNGSGK